jgi:HTH-type transcriptional regulator / antitoxin HigA
MGKNNTFQPDWASSPGETIADLLDERQLSLTDFAQRMGCTVHRAKELLRGRTEITSEVAHQLEDYLGASATFWLTREAQYRAAIESLPPELQTEGRRWLKELPVKDMTRFHWIRPMDHPRDRLAECLRFFGVPTVEAWRETYRSLLDSVVFRTSAAFASQRGAVLAWLRQGAIQGESIDCQAWNVECFRNSLPRMRALTKRSKPASFLPDLRRLCAEAGVAVAIVRAPTGCRASGATYFLSEKKALLLLSFRYLSDDQFWFSFFHEAGHLLLHGTKALFLEGFEVTSAQEQEANDFSAQVLVPAEFRVSLLNVRLEPRPLINLARRLGISPGIVVGQIQYLGRLRPNQMNSLKRRFAWESALLGAD